MANHRPAWPAIVSHRNPSSHIASLRQELLGIALRGSISPVIGSHGQRKAFLTLTNRHQQFIFHYTFAKYVGSLKQFVQLISDVSLVSASSPILREWEVLVERLRLPLSITVLPQSSTSQTKPDHYLRILK
jgi:hypothetical protein